MRMQGAVLVVALAAATPGLQAQLLPGSDERARQTRPRQGPRPELPQPGAPDPRPGPFGNRPFDRLYEVEAPPARRPSRVVCGTTVIQADPAADPKMAKAAPRERRFMMRNVRPEVCRG